MALTNPTDVITERRLSEFYQGILPYLGGNLMLRTNVSDYYSEDEKIVGVWTDGKPVYQKTIVSTLPTASEEGTLGNRSINIANLHVDTVVYSQAIVENSAKCYFNLPWPFKNGSAITTFHINPENMPETYASSRNYLVLENGHVAWNDCSVFVTIQYTKTTDAAGSATATPGAYDINFPNTWPENKEIYFGNGVYGYRATGRATSASVTLGTFTSSLKIYSCGGYLLADSGWELQLGYGVPSSNGCGLVKNPSGNLILDVHTQYVNGSAYNIWVTYTK